MTICLYASRLHPNETADTDVVLLGHSMGGILSAEVALLPSSPLHWSEAPQFRHQILGTISFDCPFLGMHPGIVISGIGSLFRPTPKSPGNQNPYLSAQDQFSGIYPNDSRRVSSPSLDSLLLSDSGRDPGMSPGASLMTGENCPTGAFEDPKTQRSIATHPYTHPSPIDPNYDPPFPNDIRLPERTGWDNALHFVTKHSHNLTQAVNSYVTSHLEFGVCMADYKGLKNRYTRLRPLEDIKPEHDHARRIRFLNYYTTCTGRPKNQKTVVVSGDGPFSCTTDARISGKHCPEGHLQDLQNLSLSALTTQSSILSPRILVDEYRDGEVHPKNDAEDPEGVQPLPEENSPTDGRIVMSENDSAQGSTDQTGSGLSVLEPSGELEPSALTLARPDELRSLPPLPSLPEGPQPYDPATYADRMSRNLAHKKYTAQFKSYLRALKAYDKAINHRLKLIEQHDNADDKAKKLSKSQETKKPQPSTQIVKLPKKLEPGPASPLPITTSKASSYTENKTKKERRFCIVPPRINGELDRCWVQVFMKDVDEVGAHCGLFVVGGHYGWLVNDVATKIQAWVEEM